MSYTRSPCSTGNDLEIGFIAGQRRKLGLSAEARQRHLYVSGTSGAGKSKFLEHLIRQDIIGQRRSGCGMLVLDPHGSLYDAVMDWLAWHPHLTTGRFARPIVPIDLTDADHVVGYNVLRPRADGVDPHVIAEEMRKAIVHAWGAHGTDQTPLLERWLDNALLPLIETGRTLPEAWWLVHDHPFREQVLQHVRDPIVRAQWERARELSARDYDAQVLSTVNRLTRFVRNASLRRMLGQTDGLDWDQALAEGWIVIVNLARRGGQTSEATARTLGTLMLSDLWTAASHRGKGSDVPRPFYVYLDEFQKFLTPDIAESLDQARGFGLHLVLSHQFPSQLLSRGTAGEQVYGSVLANAANKLAFRCEHPQDTELLAEWLFRRTLDPDQIKHQLYSRKVLDYKLEYQTAYSRSSTFGESESSGYSSGVGSSRGVGLSMGGVAPSDESGLLGTNLPDLEAQLGKDDLPDDVRRFNAHFGESNYESESSASGSFSSDSEGETEFPMLMPQMGREESVRQYRSLDEQLHLAMVALQDQEQRQFVAQVAGLREPVSVFTPKVSGLQPKPGSLDRLMQRLRGRWSFIVEKEVAEANLQARLPASAHMQMKATDHGSLNGQADDDEDDPLWFRRKV